MQKKMNAKTVGAVYTNTHTPYLYKISVQAEGRKLDNKKVIKMDEAKTYERVVGF